MSSGHFSHSSISLGLFKSIEFSVALCIAKEIAIGLENQHANPMQYKSLVNTRSFSCRVQNSVP